MSDPQNPNGQADSIPDGGILAALPRARPQRASPRRAATRSKASKAPAVAIAPKPKKTRATSAKTTNAIAKTDNAKRAAPRVRVGQPKTRPTPTPPKAKPSPAKAKPSRARQAEPPAPRQGYEPEEEVELGTTVNPPSGVELVESVADIVGELANSGLAAGGRLLKDAFSLLRRS